MVLLAFKLILCSLHSSFKLEVFVVFFISCLSCLFSSRIYFGLIFVLWVLSLCTFIKLVCFYYTIYLKPYFLLNCPHFMSCRVLFTFIVSIFIFLLFFSSIFLYIIWEDF